MKGVRDSEKMGDPCMVVPGGVKVWLELGYYRVSWKDRRWCVEMGVMITA